MKLSEANYDNSETGCCARLDEARWEGREFSWTDKPFLKDHIRSFLHIPLNFGSVISRDHTAIEGAAAYPEEPIWLTDEVSPWGADVYVATDRELPHAEMVRMTGDFMTKVFTGPYREISRWIEQMKEHVSAQGREVDKLYFFYATCPKCAKHYGKNQVVLFAKLR